MQLQQNLDQFDRAGISVFAISYDSVEAQAAFAKQYGITYSLLSDANHEAIEATGILNRLAVPDESEPGLATTEQTILKVTPFATAATERNLGESFYGIPYPGSYLIGTDGRVIEKLFYRHYRTRPSVATVLRSGFGVDFEVRDNPAAEASAAGVRIRATLGGESMTYMETSMLYVEIDLAEGLHLYGSPVPEGYVATTVTVSPPDSVEIGPVRYPGTRPFAVAGLDETFHVFEGSVEIAIPVYYVREDFEHLLRRARFLAGELEEPSAGVVRQLIAHAEETRPPTERSVRLDVSLRYQACTADACLAPRTESLQVDVPIAPVEIRDA
ncbi:MAG: Peroxiredoxin [Chloroflexi bacterium]|nr:MAG: Peroxiredoxin [Chloroflexota bacterium]